jgi:outer membrane protein
MADIWQRSLVLLGVLILLLAPLSSVQAQPKYSLGGGVGFAPDYEGSEDYEPVPLLFARAEMPSGQYVALEGLSLKANLIPDSMWELGPVIQYRMERDDVDNGRVDDLSKVDAAVEVGAFGGFKLDPWALYLTAVFDVADGHDGSLVTLRGQFSEKALNDLRITLGASTTWASDDYMEAYFSIDSRDSARSGLDTYDADSGIKDFGIDLSLNYTPWEHWGIITILKYNRLLSDAEDSPVVDDEGNENQFFAGIGVNYRF